MSSGTGSATSQPATSSRLRPKWSASAPGREVRERLRRSEGDDEGEDGGRRAKSELLLADEREDAALEADHRPDEGVERDQQPELPSVGAKPEPDARGHARAARVPERFAATICF
jgi:hypothetical protein